LLQSNYQRTFVQLRDATLVVWRGGVAMQPMMELRGNREHLQADPQRQHQAGDTGFSHPALFGGHVFPHFSELGFHLTNCKHY
jgi:hypothetical protein